MSTKGQSEAVTDLERAILNSINKGNEYVADVLDCCGPRLDEQQRGMDSAAYLDVIDQLIERGYIEREGAMFDSQLKLRLTERGEESAETLSDAEQDLVDTHGISFDELHILQLVIEYESEEGSSPSINDLQVIDDEFASAYQYTLRFNGLIAAGLASEKGIFRYRITPTEAGRQVLEEHEEHL